LIITAQNRIKDIISYQNTVNYFCKLEDKIWMMNKLFFRKKLKGIEILFLALCSCMNQKEKPNIIIIYADDLGYGDVRSYNPVNGKIPTPNINRLTAQGMRFTDAHSSSAVSSPSRYTLLTGRYHWRTRLQQGIVGLFGPPLITPDRLTIGSLAQQHDYKTACIGKWHLGWDWPIQQEEMNLFSSGQKKITATDEHREAWQKVFSQPIPGGPVAVGFDEYFGVDVPNWPPYCYIKNNRTIGIPSEFGSSRLFGKNQASLQGPALENWALEYVLPALGDHSVAFIEREVKSQNPFLLYLSVTSPHTPLAVNKEWQGKSGLGLYADLVMETDALVGRILDVLGKSGAIDNTLIIFTSDNGCAPYVGNTTKEESMDLSMKSWPWDRSNMPIAALEERGHYSSGPLRGYKSDVWEGGHRIPFIVKWPGKVEPGSSSSQLVHQADLLATIADILGSSLPADAGEDSFSLLPLLKGDTNPVREHAVCTSIRGLPSLRQDSWKFIFGPGSGGWSPGSDEDPVQLYNLENDLGETTNLASEKPGRVSEMKVLLEKLITDGRSTPGLLQKNDVEVRRYNK